LTLGRAEGAVRLLLLSHYYPPEVGAAQTRLRETVSALRDRGFEITVVAPAPSYPLGIVPEGYARGRPAREHLDGALVIRLPSAGMQGAGMSRRLLGQASFALSAISTMAIADRFEVALIESPPLLLAFPARALQLRGLPYVFHVADPWPDFPIAMGYLQSKLERRLAFGIEDLAYRGAAAITTVSPGLVDLLSGKPSAAGRVELIPNAVKVDRFLPDAQPAAMRAELGWEELFTIVYAGTVGLAQGIGTLLEAARLLGPGVAIRVVGDGVERPALEEQAASMKLSNLTFHPSIPRDGVPALVAAADAGLVLLRKGPLYEDSLPTKLLETMAASRPVIVSADGLTARIVDRADGGYLAPAEDAAALARAIDACRRDPERAARGSRARAYVAEHYERGAIMDRLAEILVRSARTTQA
jgi:colanic acid biosynthesis glycosyl transferase WcaI